MELTEQSHILNRVVSKGYVDSAVFIERQNTLTLELATAKKKEGSFLTAMGLTEKLLRRSY